MEDDDAVPDEVPVVESSEELVSDDVVPDEVVPEEDVPVPVVLEESRLLEVPEDEDVLDVE